MSGASEAQLRAARPDASSWVSANAGSGKTRVLTDRVARLLLSGAEPHKILCLTYTKAAAAEMQNRLFKTLGGWAMLDDAPLHAALEALGQPGVALSPAALAHARTLFARALETPGGLKIQTIHAFCDALLRRFPLEAGVAPQFAVLEERRARALRGEAFDVVAENEPAPFAETALHFTGADPDAFLQEINHHRPAFSGTFDPDHLAAELGISAGLSLNGLHDAVMGPGGEAMLRALAAVLAMSGKNDRQAGEAISAALAVTELDARLRALEACLLLKSGEAAFTAKADKLPANGVKAEHPELVAELHALMQRVEEGRPRRLALSAFERSSVLNRFARVWLAAYGARKRALGVLDFDDLIERSSGLLRRPETAAWVLWRLDGGLDHILVDEAQDTSPGQWSVIDAISEEFFAGAGARTIERTIFVVGDEKQSIYSFQGADPTSFGTMRQHFDAMLDRMGDALERCDLLYSFRSAPPILRLVDAVFEGPAGAGLSDATTHLAIAEDKPGRVDLWPFLPKPEKPDESPWDKPLDAPMPDDPALVLAGRIAGRIAAWLAEKTLLPGLGRPVRAGDVMILVQRRNDLFDAIIRALKQANVPVAGADVIRVGAELAVRDLLAALRVAATPGDDLSLAAFLRSPLGGLDEAEIFALAHGREGSLWAALRAQPAPRWTEVRRMLSDVLGQADYLRPFDLLERLLVRHDGRRRIVARLGSEAEDGIDALLDQALAYESVEAPSLTGFLSWIDRDEMTVKRRFDDGIDQVRVMTVHGAKGLEAPIVILPDTAERSESSNPPQILRDAHGRALWKMPANGSPPALARAENARRDLVRQENRRLLYVALTRAETWLIVCGAGPEPKAEGGAWHVLVRAAMERLGPKREPGPDGETWTLSENWEDAIAERDTKGAARPAPLPAWLRRPAPARVDAALGLLSPSGLGGAHVVPGEGGLVESEAVARARGTAIHKLLEVLGGHDPEAWPALAERLLPDSADRADLLAEAARVLQQSDLRPVFAPGTLAEVNVSASLPDLKGARISGRIDRLLIKADRIMAVDFKSNRVVPERPEQVPEGIVRQMAAYRAALAEIWPHRRIDTAILWTSRPSLMPLPDPLLRAALTHAGHLDPARAAP